jgi:hypothetical protein
MGSKGQYKELMVDRISGELKVERWTFGYIGPRVGRESIVRGVATVVVIRWRMNQTLTRGHLLISERMLFFAFNAIRFAASQP